MPIPSAPNGQNILSGINYCFNVTKTSATNLNIAVKRWNYLKDRPKNFISVKDWLKTKDNAEKAKKTADNLINGKWKELGKLGKFAQVAGFAMAAIGYILGIKNAGDIQTLQNVSVNVWEAQSKEFERNLRLFKRQDSQIKQIEAKIKQVEKLVRINDSNNRTTGLRAQQAFTNSVRARELGNNALYEARQGRLKVEAKVISIQAGVNKFIADTNSKFFTLNLQFQNILKQVTGNAQATIQNTIKQIQSNLNSQNLQLNNQASQINNLNAQIKQINLKSTQQQQPTFNEQKIINEATIKAAAQATTAVRTVVEPRIRVLESANQTIRIDLDSLEKVYGTTQNANEIKDNALNNQDKALAAAIAAVAAQINQLKMAESKPRFERGENKALNEIEKLKQILNQLQQQQKQMQEEQKKQENKLKEQDKLNQQGLNILEGLKGLPLIVGRVENNVVNLNNKITEIPNQTIQQIKPEIPPLVGEAICTSAKNGCLKDALNQNVNDINDTTKSSNNALFDKLNALLNGLSLGSDAASMTLLNTINDKLGDQLPGGLSKKLKDGFNWLKFDRILNVLTWWQTLHNGAMLSSNIVQSLAQGGNNILDFLGIKDDEGNNIDIGSIVGKTYENLIKSALGEETYNNINKAWNAANRIYQSSSSMLSLVQSTHQSILSGLEYIGAGQGKVANALKRTGVVFENSYPWMNENPSFSNPFINALEKAQEGTSLIEQIIQVPLDVKTNFESLGEEKKNFTEALKDGEDALKGLGIIESENQKNEYVLIKQSSLGKDVDILDKLEAEDN